MQQIHAKFIHDCKCSHLVFMGSVCFLFQVLLDVAVSVSGRSGAVAKGIEVWPQNVSHLPDIAGCQVLHCHIKFLLSQTGSKNLRDHVTQSVGCDW